MGLWDGGGLAQSPLEWGGESAVVSTGMQGGLAQRPLEWPSECQLPSSHPGQTASHDFCMQSERTYSAGALVWGGGRDVLAPSTESLRALGLGVDERSNLVGSGRLVSAPAACQSPAIRATQSQSEAIRGKRQSTHQQHAKVRLHRTIREGDGDDEVARNE